MKLPWLMWEVETRQQVAPRGALGAEQGMVALAAPPCPEILISPNRKGVINLMAGSRNHNLVGIVAFRHKKRYKAQNWFWGRIEGWRGALGLQEGFVQLGAAGCTRSCRYPALAKLC